MAQGTPLDALLLFCQQCMWGSWVSIKAQQTLISEPCYNSVLQISTFYLLYVLWFHSSPLYLFSGLKHGSNIQINLSRGMTQIDFTF